MRSILYIQYFIQVHYVHCSSLVEFFLHSSRKREPLGRSIQLLGHHHDHGNHWKPPDLYYNLCCLVIFFLVCTLAGAAKRCEEDLGDAPRQAERKKIWGFRSRKTWHLTRSPGIFMISIRIHSWKSWDETSWTKQLGESTETTLGFHWEKWGVLRTIHENLLLKAWRCWITLEMYRWCVQIIWVAWFSRIRLINEHCSGLELLS